MNVIIVKISTNPGLFFVYICPFLIPTSITISIIQIEKSVDGVLGIRILGHRMVGADETMELLRPLLFLRICLITKSISIEKNQLATLNGSGGYDDVDDEEDSQVAAAADPRSKSNFVSKTFDTRRRRKRIIYLSPSSIYVNLASFHVLLLLSSVTRWLDYFSIFGHL